MTTDLLFASPEQPSPRLVWMRKHDVRTVHLPKMAPATQWEVRSIQTAALLGLGDTEENALKDAAHIAGWKLWSEEEAL